MPIESTRPLNINIQIQNVNTKTAAEVTANVSSSSSDVVAPKNFAGRTVRLIKDVASWAVSETKTYAQWLTKDTGKDIKAGAAFVAKKFSEGIRSLHEKFQLYRADKKANKEWNLSTARAEQRYSESHSTKAASRLLQPKLQPQMASQNKIIDQETKDIQTRLKLLKLPEVPDRDPNI
jgi:hypothetical protein